MKNDLLHAQWQERVTAQAASGLTQKAFCEQHGLVLHQFSYWRSRLSEPVSADAGSSPWCQVEIAGAGAPGGVSIFAGGARIEVRANFDAALLRAVVRALETASC